MKQIFPSKKTLEPIDFYDRTRTSRTDRPWLILNMIASIDDGYYLTRSSNGQADSTSEFMFGVPLGYEIKGGKLGNAIKDTTISGVAFDVLKTIEMISFVMN